MAEPNDDTQKNDGTKSKDAPRKEVPGKDAPRKDAPGKDAPRKDAPGEDSPDLIRAPLRGEVNRRGFLSTLGFGWAAFAAASAGLAGAMGRFMFPNVLYEPPQEFKAGFPDEYAIDQVDERFKAGYGVWIVRNSEGFYALSTVCTHLGCTPNWLAADEKFKCPCHGSGFVKTGINIEGPAPRPLERFKILLAEDGQILIDKNAKFQQEKGQWELDGAFLPYV